MPVETLLELIEALSTGQFTKVEGTAENQTIEFKGAAYILDSAKDACDLVADVASLANEQGGGIVLGFGTKRAEGANHEFADDLRPVPSQLVDEERYRKVIRQHASPPPRFEMRRYSVEAGKEVVLLHVESQPDDERPVIVDRILDTQGDPSQPNAIGWPRRYGALTHWETAGRIQQMLAQARRGPAPTAAPAPPPAAPAGQGAVASHLAMLDDLDEWRGPGRFVFHAVPTAPSRPVQDFFGAFRQSVEHWRTQRQHGFGLGLTYRPAEPRDGSLVSADDRTFVAIDRAGVVTAAVNGVPDMLGWSHHPNDQAWGDADRLIANVYVIVEFPTEFSRLVRSLVADHVEPAAWTYTASGVNLLTPTPMLLRPPTRLLGVGGDYQAIANSFTETIRSGDDFQRDAFELVAAVFGNGFGLGRDRVPFAVNERIDLTTIPKV